MEPTPDTHDTSPEDGAGRAARAVDDFAALSQRHAARGEARAALLAMWASDVEALQVLLWENGIGQAPDPAAQLAAVGDAVAQSVAVAGDELAGLTARGVVERCREAMVATFDQSVHDVLAGRFRAADHLDDLPAPGAGEATAADPRLGGSTAEQLLADLQVTAADCMAVAEVLLAEDDPSGAAEQVRQADLAMFEAYLVAAALGAGDTALGSVGLRWARAEQSPAGDVAGRPVTDPGALRADVLARREQLAEVVGWAESPVLRACFHPVVVP